jgi:hypothetical protein
MGRTLIVLLAAGALCAATTAAFVVVPQLVVEERTLSPDRQRALRAQNDARTAALAALAGVILAAGTAATLRTVRLTRHAQLTERFTGAITQLASDKPQTRVAGILALERLARESRGDRPATFAVLGDHLRDRCPAPIDEAPPVERASPDVRAVAGALRRLGRRVGLMDLSGVDLRAAPLDGVRLEGAQLQRACLAGAFLRNANLRGADVALANLRGASLEGADLRRADLTGADLTRAHTTTKTRFDGAQLEETTGLSVTRSGTVAA